MGMTLEKTILAIITVSEQKIAGGAPIFYAKDVTEMQQISFTLEKILDAMAHTLTEETMIVVKHF